MKTAQNYLESAIQQFGYYKRLGEKTFDQLTDEHLFWQYNAGSNSIAMIVQQYAFEIYRFSYLRR